MSFITVKNVSKTFDGVSVLKNISLELDEGETLGILGKSGSGKSVLISMLRGTKEYAPDEGEIIFHLAHCDKCHHVEAPSKAGSKCECGGELKIKDIDFWNADRLDFNAIKRQISIMLQRNFALYDEETVIENVLRAMGDEKRYLEENVHRSLELLNMVQMNHRITHIARDLSGGEKQRVVLARQLAKNPMIFLADEPTGTLDPQTAEKLHNTLESEVKDKGITMVITSHWPEVISLLSDKVIWLENGEIKEEGDPSTIVDKFMATVPKSEKPEKYESGGPEIVMKNVNKHYYSLERGVVKADNNVSLTINKNEICGIVGLSGSGKTTLTRMILGITDPSSGEINVKLGDDWIDMTKSGPLNRGRVTPYIGLLHQEYTLYPSNTILSNLTEAISLNLPGEFAKIKAASVLSAVGFEDAVIDTILEKYPEQLSVGERHRIALAQVLIREPNIIILDEPTGTMDPITREIVSDSIIRARERFKQTFVIVSHDMDFVLKICDSAILMRNGEILKSGNPEDIVSMLTSEEKEDMLKDQ